MNRVEEDKSDKFDGLLGKIRGNLKREEASRGLLSTSHRGDLPDDFIAEHDNYLGEF